MILFCSANRGQRYQDFGLGEASGLTLGQGWLPRAEGDTGVWMGRQAEIVLNRPAQRVKLPIIALPQSWQRAVPPFATQNRATNH